MGMRPIPMTATLPTFANPIWFTTDSNEEDKELWHLEQEISTELERVEQKHSDLTPIGKSATNEVKPINYVDEEEEEDEEEDDNDDDESESREDDDDEEIDLDIEDQDSPTF